MLYPLHTITSIKYQVLCLLALCLLSFNGCKDKGKEEPDSRTAGIDGLIDVPEIYTTHPNGFLITLESMSDDGERHSAVSDSNGKFSFRNLAAGKYTIDVEKEGYKRAWMVDEDKIVSTGVKTIELSNNKIKNLKIRMEDIYYDDIGALDITDLSGNPIGVIGISNMATMVSFRLYNGTQSSHTWSVDDRYCFGTIDFAPVQVFSSFNMTQGRLEPGDNVLVIGYVNPEIFSPKFSMANGDLYISDSGSISSRKSIYIYLAN